jgi:predicted ATP-grasp superfamily ATP-dependent carboligase
VSARGNRAAVIPAAAASSLACLRSLGRRGIHTIAVSERDTAPEFRSRYCSERHVVPSPYDRAIDYKDALLTLARREDVRTITPIREADVYLLSKYRSEFQSHITPLWPDRDTIETVYDRVRLIDAAREAGVTVPETLRFDDVVDWSHEQIAKPRYAILASDYVESVAPTTLANPGSTTYLEPGTSPDPDELRSRMGHLPIVQEYIPGQEYALWALYDHGEPVVTCQKHQMRGYTYAGDASVARETVSIPELEEAGRTLLDHLDWHGPASVQFIRDARTGEFTLLEINPRFWLSVQCPIQAGVDFPYYYWRLANDEPVDAPERCPVGVATHLLRGELLYLDSVLRHDYPLVEPPAFSTALWAVARSIVDQPHFDYLSLDDPVPFVRDALNTTIEGLQLVHSSADR